MTDCLSQCNLREILHHFDIECTESDQPVYKLN
jgi:hypothetical protein